MKDQSQKMVSKSKQAIISKVFPSIPSDPSRNILEKSKFFMKNLVFSPSNKLSYV